jgi:hypothetical protein
MRCVNATIAEPRRRGLVTGDRFEVREQRIAVSAGPPFATDGNTVTSESLLVASPHLRGRVAAPAFDLAGKGHEDLLGFDSLLAETLVVKDAR